MLPVSPMMAAASVILIPVMVVIVCPVAGSNCWRSKRLSRGTRSWLAKSSSQSCRISSALSCKASEPGRARIVAELSRIVCALLRMAISRLAPLCGPTLPPGQIEQQAGQHLDIVADQVLWEREVTEEAQ